jgi:signal transduction histidine kinase
MKLPSPFPMFDPPTGALQDGNSVPACAFCKNAFKKTLVCKQHYSGLLRQPDGYYQCPFGFTTRSFHFGGEHKMITGLVAFPRFGTPDETEKAKNYPQVRIAREAVEDVLRFFASVETLRADTVQEATKVFPQAFHELRKLNGAILQHAEKEIRDRGVSATLTTIKSAAELMRNNFDILEALSNIEGMRALPVNATINVWDLVYKTKCVLQERAAARSMSLNLNGMSSHPIIRGSQKSFPIVPAVLLENAIKYGRERTTIDIGLTVSGVTAQLSVDNQTDHPIDAQKCFERGSRYSPAAAEGGGFGLFLAKEVVTAHKGIIRCEPRAGAVRMIVELPVQKVV